MAPVRHCPGRWRPSANGRASPDSAAYSPTPRNDPAALWITISSELFGPARGQKANCSFMTSPEDDRSAAVQQDPVLGVPADRAGQGDPLRVAPDGREIRRR